MKFTLNRDYVLVTPEGPSYGFKKGVPLHVPAKYAAKVLEIGGEPVEEDAEAARDAAEKAQVAVDATADQKAKLLDIVRNIIERNDPADFTAGGRPKQQKVSIVAGFDVSKQQIDAAWASLIAEKHK
jgi:hypothetical protein